MRSTATERSPATTAQYLATYERIRRRIAALDGVHDSEYVTPEKIVRHLVQERPTWAKRTWIFYKCAVLVGLEFSLLEALPDAKERIQLAMASLAQERQSEAKSKGSRTSARKAKSFSPAHQIRLIEHLKDRFLGGDTNACELFLFMSAALAVGLRPGEWERAILVEENGVPTLKVMNAKATNDRGNGSVRTLYLTGLGTDQLSAIKAMLEIASRVAQEPGGYLQWQNRMRNYFRRRAKFALGANVKVPCPYTCRHQFAADAKATLSQEEVAALLGHGSSATAGRSYAKARRANGKTRVRPDAAEVLTVRTPSNARHPIFRNEGPRIEPH